VSYQYIIHARKEKRKKKRKKKKNLTEGADTAQAMIDRATQIPYAIRISSFVISALLYSTLLYSTLPSEPSHLLCSQYKSKTALNGPLDPIPISVVAQGRPTVGYEAELVIVIGRLTLNISAADALSHTIGYTVGNDVSHRDSQIRRGQWSMSKGFDGWALFGPAITATALVGDVDEDI